MLHPDARRWNARYISEQERYLKRTSYALVNAYVEQLPSNGLVLDVAAGAAPASLLLAERGLHVIAMDISETGLRLAQQRARARSLPLSLVVMDMSDPWLPASTFDIILNFYYLSRPLFERYRQALKPGGWLFFETFVQQTHRRCNSAHYLETEELYHTFKDWKILHWAETWKRRSDGTLYTKMVAQLIARKIS
ncbi:MAG: class I SAM-dependent methyltransferase [Chloroflexota bacterium]